MAGAREENIVSNEIVHVTDIFTTLLTAAGVNQLDFLLDSESRKSPRQGFLFYIKKELVAIKWRDWKLHFIWSPEVNNSKGKLESPYLLNIVRNPKEESNVMAFNTWVLQLRLKMFRSDRYSGYPFISFFSTSYR